MDTTNYAIITLSWVGLVALTFLGSATAYFWALLLWDKGLKRLFWPAALSRATRIAITLRYVRNPKAHAAYVVATAIIEADKGSEGFLNEVLRCLPPPAPTSSMLE